MITVDGDECLTSYCIVCGSVWNTVIRYEPVLGAFKVHISHLEQHMTYALTGEVLAASRGDVLAFAVETLTRELGEKTSCFPKMARLYPPVWSHGDPRLGFVGSVA